MGTFSPKFNSGTDSTEKSFPGDGFFFQRNRPLALLGRFLQGTNSPDTEVPGAISLNCART